MAFKKKTPAISHPIFTFSRELAFQIAEQFAVLGAALNVQTAVVVGGMDMMAQALELENRPHVVIATPGRIVDHLRSSSGQWNLSRVKFLVCNSSCFFMECNLNGFFVCL